VHVRLSAPSDMLLAHGIACESLRDASSHEWQSRSQRG
jgi:hypothetical protein